MSRQVPLWQWIVIAIGLLIILAGAGRWIYNRLSVSKAPPPASPAEVQKEYQEQVLGYPVQPQRR
ncbi:MAG: hypothetical protein NZ805_09875 [Armatimonadetes bacterium]|nr:hypothetical protein [Armatimonadota bacterium]MDW8028944.1 hypothetical protein [Armatimonadota bacterium]